MDSINKANPDQQQATVSSLSTAFDVMNAVAAQAHPCYQFKYKTYSGMGAYITSICGVAPNHEAKMYWMYYVNGKKANVGVSSYVPNQNDVITWKYEKVSW